MNAELKAKWVAALRSGKYKQGRESYYDSDDDTYCALGVLLDQVGCREGGMKELWDLGVPTLVRRQIAKLNDGDWTGAGALSFEQLAKHIEQREDL